MQYLTSQYKILHCKEEFCNLLLSFLLICFKHKNHPTETLPYPYSDEGNPPWEAVSTSLCETQNHRVIPCKAYKLLFMDLTLFILIMQMLCSVTNWTLVIQVPCSLNSYRASQSFLLKIKSLISCSKIVL